MRLGGRATPLFSRDSVTRSVLPRFFSRSPVTSPVTCRDKVGRAVTFLIFDFGLGTKAKPLVETSGAVGTPHPTCFKKCLRAED
jgi:hypothetical protein